jgi:hypothetical protein
MARQVAYFHEEQTFSPWLVWGIAAVFGIPAAFALIESWLHVGLIGPSLVSLLIFVPIVLVFFLARLVVDVDRDEIRVSFHFLWPRRRIPVTKIARARATEYNPLLDYGGWGVRLSWKGWAFNTGGAEGALVETSDGKRVMIGSRRPKDLEAAIARAVAEQHSAR